MVLQAMHLAVDGLCTICELLALSSLEDSDVFLSLQGLFQGCTSCVHAMRVDEMLVRATVKHDACSRS